jgi:hypothetical protein
VWMRETEMDVKRERERLSRHVVTKINELDEETLLSLFSFSLSLSI